MNANGNGVTHGALKEDLPAYALGALDDAKELEAHLADCASCQRELAELRLAVDAIAGSVEPRRPPRRLRRRILATTRSQRDATARGGEQWRGWRPVLAVASVAGVLAAGAIGYALRGDGVETTTIAAEPTPAAPAGAQAELVRAGDVAVLRTTGLAPLASGDVYQAWVRDGSSIEPSSTYVVDRSGAGAVAIPESLAGADEVMVTREPAGGSERPSTAPLIRVSSS
jgi:Anti-sigma-K factor rskA